MTHCIIFGGCRGIGAGIARLLLSNNYNISVVSKSNRSIEEFVHDIHKTQAFQRPIGLKADVTDEEAVNKAVTTAEKWFGPVNIIVNAAGINKDNLLSKTNRTDMENIIQTNLIGPMITTKAVLKSMMKQKKGCIINIGSVVGQHGNSGQCVYSASKSGLMGFTKSLAKEVGSRGIRVNLIAPGFIETEMTKHLTEKQRNTINNIPLQRFGNPKDVAYLVQFVIECEYITGQVLYTDGGLHLNL